MCCRIRDYESLSERLQLRSAICVQPLTDAQINQYLHQAGEQLSALQTLLKHNEEIRAFASSPLILSIMSLAYRGCSLHEINPGKTILEYRQLLFDTYINRMFEGARKVSYTQRIAESAKKYPRKKAQHWLIWLAQRMVQESQTMFLIERLQPSWLPSQRYRVDYRIISILGFVLSLVFGFVPEFMSSILNSQFDPTNTLIDHLGDSLPIGLLFGLFGGLLSGLIASLIVGPSANIETVETLKWSWREAKKSFRHGLMGGLVFGLLFGLLFGLISFGFSRSPIMHPSSGAGLWKSLQSGLNTLLNVWLFCILIGGLIAGISGGFRGPKLQQSNIPNQGIWRSGKNSLIVGLFVSLVTGLPFALLNFRDGLSAGLSTGLMFGLIPGLISGWICGGSACFWHFALRLMLYRLGYIPWNYPRFLDYAAERLFLQKVGGGYIFVHRMLLEHFAQMSNE